jgi:hypothetical protein
MVNLDPRELQTTAASLGDPIEVGFAFVDAWRQLHYAAQIAAEVGKSWAAPQADDSHSNFEWRDGFLLGARVAAQRPFRAALRAQDLGLRLVADDGAVLAARALAGTTIDEATNWVRAQAALFAGEGARQSAIPAPDLPPHPVASGARFEVGDRAAFAALARLLGGADALLRSIATGLPGASPVRVWPHHFDMATLFALSPGATIGAGLAVPDASETSGYWYVSPWMERPPAAGAASWPPLAHGRWIGNGALSMAALPLGALAGIEKPEERAQALALFFGEAIAIVEANLRS